MTLWEKIIEIDHLYGLIYALLGAFICFVFKTIYTCISQSSKYSGKYKAVSRDENGDVLKEDNCKIKHNKRTGIFRGKIKRVFPDEELGKKQNVIGVIMADRFLCSVYANAPIRTMSAVYAILYENYCFKGHYFWYDITENTSKQINIEIEKRIKL